MRLITWLFLKLGDIFQQLHFSNFDHVTRTGPLFQRFICLEILQKGDHCLHLPLLSPTILPHLYVIELAMGQKTKQKQNNTTTSNVIKLKMWLPRKCVLEFDHPTLHGEHSQAAKKFCESFDLYFQGLLISQIKDLKFPKNRDIRDLMSKLSSASQITYLRHNDTFLGTKGICSMCNLLSRIMQGQTLRRLEDKRTL